MAGSSERIVHPVAGELRHEETIVRQILVDCLHYPVAIAPGVGVRNHRGAAEIVFTIAGDVEPVAAPVLAEMRGGQESGDQLATASRDCDLRRRLRILLHRAAGHQVEVERAESTCVCPRVCLRQAFGFERLCDQLIDLLVGLVMSQGAEGPVRVGFGPWGAFVYPAFYGLGFLWAQRRVGGIGFTVASCNGLVCAAFRRVTECRRWRPRTCPRAASRRANRGAVRPSPSESGRPSSAKPEPFGPPLRWTHLPILPRSGITVPGDSANEQNLLVRSISERRGEVGRL